MPNKDDTKYALVYDKTEGHCHFCGDHINRRWRRSPHGHWHLDHITHKSKGGLDTVANYLAACTACNGLRWNRSGQSLRNVIRLGLIAKGQVKAETKIGKRLAELQKLQKATNRVRRAN
jgi:5-methylcytosine-specific restriction endonuclease McrA